MFEALKKRRRDITKNITAWLIFTLIILVFVFWGMSPQESGFGAGGSAAVVNDSVITLAEWESRVDQLMRNSPETGAVSAADQQRRRAEALDQLVNFELLVQAAQKAGVLITDEEVRENVINDPAFQENGRFSRDRYRAILANARLTPGRYEEQVRRTEAVQKTVRLLDQSLRPSKLETDKTELLAKTKTNVEFLTVPLESVVKPESISDKEVAGFLAQEGREAKAKEYYDAHLAEFSKPEEVNARHILIRAEKGDAEAESKAKEQVEQIRKRLEKEDFAKVAKETSDDPGSKDKGGDLGWFSRGRMVPEFETAAFSLQPGTVSEPIRTDFGFHLIKVQEKRDAKTTPFEEAKNTIVKKQMAQERSKDVIAKFEEAVKGRDAESLRKLASAYDLKWEETGFFSLESEFIPKVGMNDEFARVAFNLDAANPLASEIVRQGPSAYVVRYKGGKAPEENEAMQPEFMKEMMAQQKMQQVLSRWVSQLRNSSTIRMNESLNPQVQ